MAREPFLCQFYSKYFDISSKVFPFVSGKTKVATKKKIPVNTDNVINTYSKPVDSTHDGNTDAIVADTD